MPIHMCMGSLMKCTHGVAPSPLMVLPTSAALTSGQFVATMMDFIPNLNIKTFGMCNSLGNPTVAAATAAAMGALTPMPCTFVPNGTWRGASPPTIGIGGSLMPTLNPASFLLCSYGGTITFMFSPQTTVMVP